MTCCWRGVMDQRLFRGLNFFDSAGASRLVRQTERQITEGPAEQAAEYQVCLSAVSLAQPKGKQRLLGMPMHNPDSRLALAPLIG